MDDFPITDYQREMLAVIYAFIKKHRQPPKLREIATGIGRPKSQGTVHLYLRYLEKQGFIRFVPGKRQVAAVRLAVEDEWASICVVCHPPAEATPEQRERVEQFAREVFGGDPKRTVWEAAYEKRRRRREGRRRG